MNRVAVVLVLLGTGIAMPPDLAPGTLLLSRVKHHVEEELGRLENISCVETIERERQPPRGKMRALDTVRLEVLYSSGEEFFASPGGRKFSPQHPISYVGSGMMGTGFFGGYLKEILLSESISNEYKGEGEIGGRRLARYNYRLPLMWSKNELRLVEGSGTVGLHGSYWVDPRTYDMVRLEFAADDIPPTLPITEAETRIDYARISVDTGALVLLPQSADLRLAKLTGEIEHNRMEFTHCRVFSTQSELKFDAPDTGEPSRFGVSSVDDTLRPLPAGLAIAIKLRTRIAGDMAVGTLIEGAVAGNVVAKHNLIIAAESPVLGRIRRLERYAEPFPHYVVALEFTELEVNGIRHRFYADPMGVQPLAGVEHVKLESKNDFEKSDLLGGVGLTSQRRENLFLFNLPGVVSFFVRNAKLDLPSGFRTDWKTRAFKP